MGSSGRLIILGGLGFAAVGAAMFLFARSQAAVGGSSGLGAIAWVLALTGVGCMAAAIYFLLKRLGRTND